MKLKGLEQKSTSEIKRKEQLTKKSVIKIALRGVIVNI